MVSKHHPSIDRLVIQKSNIIMFLGGHEDQPHARAPDRETRYQFVFLLGAEEIQLLTFSWVADISVGESGDRLTRASKVHSLHHVYFAAPNHRP